MQCPCGTACGVVLGGEDAMLLQQAVDAVRYRGRVPWQVELMRVLSQGVPFRAAHLL